MSHIRVIVAGAFSSAPFASGLRVLLADSGHFEVVELADEDGLDDLLVDDRPITLILEGSDPSKSLDLLESSHNLSVIMLDPVGGKTIIGVDNPSWSGLVELIETVAANSTGGTGRPANSRLRIVKPHDLLRMPVPGEVDESMAGVVEWLDLTLGLHLLRRERHQTGGSIPGWSLAPSDALTTLGIDAALSEADLRERLTRADRSLIVERHRLPATLERVARTFSLDHVDLRLVCLLLAPEIDGRYSSAIGVLRDDLSARRPDLTLLAELLGVHGRAWELRRQLALPGSLVDRELITPAADASGAVAVDIGYAVRRAVVESLLSETMEDAARALGAQMSHPGHVALTPAERRQSDQLANLAARTRAPMLIGLREGDPDGWFGRIALGAGFPLVQADVRELTGNSQPCEAIADWLTLGALAGSAVMVLGLDTLDASQLRHVGSMLERVDLDVPFVALDGFIEHMVDQKRSIVRFDKPSYSAAEKTALWMAAAARAGLELTEHDAHTLGASAQIGPTEIETCVTRCASLPPTGESLCRRLRRTATDMKQAPIPAAIRRVETVFGWHDLVLPEDVKAVLRSLSDHVTHSGRVMTSWGFSTRLPYGQGVAALFSGPSGTGKTMAAQIIAADLGFELFQVDLSKTVSKYIGDTEKNIDGVFDAAERQSAVLLFDEADALFAKRSEVKDAHDRHANVEVAYLLQRMEAFSGVAVLTSNLKQNIDQAFLRRLRFVVEFPFPDAADREAIWRRSFPADAPMADDIDLAFLARRLKLTGGNIQQIALHAAFAAATDGDQIRMSHVVAATRRELVKLGMFNADKTLDERAA